MNAIDSNLGYSITQPLRKGLLEITHQLEHQRAKPEGLQVAQYGRMKETFALMRPQDTIVILHDNDMDGCCSNALLRYYLKHHTKACLNNVVSIAIGHGKPFQDMEYTKDLATTPTFLIVLDHECSMELQHTLNTHTHHLMIIDHHPTTVDRDPRCIEVIHGQGQSTTALVGMLFDHDANTSADHRRRILVDIVDYYDVWRFDQYGPMAEAVVKAFASEVMMVGATKVDWESLLNNTPEDGAWNGPFGVTQPIADFTMKGMARRGFQIETIEKLRSAAVVKCRSKQPALSGRKFGLVFHGELMDELGNAILKNDPDMDFVVVVYTKAKGDYPYKLSIRSMNERFDASTVAGIYGGGGHHNASGANLTTQGFLDFMADTEVINGG